MLVHNNSSFCIYFGDAADQLFPKDYLHFSKATHLLDSAPFFPLKKLISLDSLVFLRQVHSAKGMNVKKSTTQSFVDEGDFLLTNVKRIGLGVMTADCLPIIFYDTVNHAVAIVHAGWKGSVQKIAVKTIKCMQQEFNTHINNIRVFFGPSAKVCCYKVDDNFLQYVNEFNFVDDVIHKHNGDLFFDLPGFNRLQLEDIGITKKAFEFEYNICTICDHRFFSYRRQGEQAGRQMTVVCLR